MAALVEDTGRGGEGILHIDEGGEEGCHRQPPGAPRGTRWLPVTTFFATFVDMQNALTPTPGVFNEGGHDYRRAIPGALRTVFSLPATDTQMTRVEQALQYRVLGWETKRRWDATTSMPAAERSQARSALDTTVSGWVGHTVDDAGVEAIIENDTGGTAKSMLD